MKVLLVTEKPFSSDAVAEIEKIIKNAGYEFEKLERYAQKDELLTAIHTANAIIIRSDIIDREVIEHAPNLKIIVRAGAGYDNVDLQAASEKSIVVMNTPGQNSNAVAELVFGLLLYVHRDFFQGKTGDELKGKRLGLHAFGHTAQNVARIAKGFDMEINAYDPQMLEFAGHKKDGVKFYASPEQLYEESDIVSLHIPAIPATIKSINKNLLTRMPANGTLVNTARKEVIDEAEVLDFMKRNPQFKFVTDIKPDLNEEFKANFPDRYFSTPKKMGAQTLEANQNAGFAAAKQIVDYLKNGVETFRVNK